MKYLVPLLLLGACTSTGTSVPRPTQEMITVCGRTMTVTLYNKLKDAGQLECEDIA